MAEASAARAAAMAAVRAFSPEGRALHHGAWMALREGEARVAAPEDAEVIVPVPPGAADLRVTAVRHDGTEALHRWSPDPHGCLVFVPDGGGPVAWIRLRWTPPGDSARH
jgi:hypothetical protein